MATTVTIKDFMARFPQFDDGTQDDAVKQLLVEATQVVDDTWEDADIKPAILYLVAHQLTSEGQADSPAVTGERLGPISMTYAAPQNGEDPLARTEFGRRFLEIRKRNFTGPVVI
jgi:hypothetical protein